MPVMNDREREQLLGYLLGALDDEEQEALEVQLKHDATLRQQLAELHKILGPLRTGKTTYAAPTGLAERTCQAVANAAADSIARSHPGRAAVTPDPARLSGLAGETALTPAASDAAPAVVASGGWSWLDLAVAASILVASFLLLFPAIENSRFRSQIVACQDNLRQIGMALVQYSQRNNGYFPYVPSQGRLAAAGVYAPTLVNSGDLTESRLVVCPGSPMAQRGGFVIPTLQQLEMAEPGDNLNQLRNTMGGSYGYSLGYTVDGAYRPTRNLGRPMFALMADAPDYTQPGFQSLNHGGRGQNVLFEDGRVIFLPSPKPNQQADDVFLNDTGLVAAGVHQDDSVVSASGTAPFESRPTPATHEK